MHGSLGCYYDGLFLLNDFSHGLSGNSVTFKSKFHKPRYFSQVAHFISELKSSSQDDAKDECQAPSPESSTFLSPWLRPRKVESPHPVRDAYQCCETVVLPGVSCLYLNFDLRCATQYDYDKVGRVTEVCSRAKSSWNPCYDPFASHKLILEIFF